MIIDFANKLVRRLDENSARAKVIRRRIEANDEVARKQILPIHFGNGVWINKNVRERSGGITDIAASLKQSEHFAYEAVKFGYGIRITGCIDRGVVGFVVDE